MGMESYYFSIDIQTIASIENILDFFSRHYTVKPYSPIKKRKRETGSTNNRYSIEHKLIVQLQKHASGVIISFEVCFSNYENNIVFLFEFLHLLNIFGSIKLFLSNHEYCYEKLCFDEFKMLLKDSHSVKLDIFLKKYGSIKRDSLPEEFYRRLIIRSLLNMDKHND